ncbi:aldo/keto reductase [uncultured Bifidobacterium sp.]|uniref:aldo/keto reductase n=1 Tax=uncultured Bifidobacterium sp. TaxID=165187 RepID=UPI0025941B06|nr:aldo/keto reductase [uncultured Bifidobacterium sp.]
MITFNMNDGHVIPSVGYGVYLMSPAEVEAHLPEAIEAGYRHIDTANAYFNEKAVGRVVRRSGIDRGEFFITSKLFPQDYGAEDCGKAIDATLRRLDTDYLDLLLLHQPYGRYTEAWQVMEEAVAAGKVRSIGLSNFNQAKTQEVLDVASVTPAVLQVEIHPYWNQHGMKAFLKDRNVTFEAWYPLGHGDAKLLAEPVFARLAEKYGRTPAQIILRWHLQEGNVVFPKTLNPVHMAENIDIFDFSLTDDEMAEINALPQRAYYDVPEEAPAFVLQHNDWDAQE